MLKLFIPLYMFARLLGQIVDGLDNLIDEWYPGLTSIDPMLGQEILEILSPCPQCPDSKYAHNIPHCYIGSMN